MPNSRITPRDTYSFSSSDRGYLLSHARPLIKSDAFDMRALPTRSFCGRILVITPKKMGTAPKRNLIRRRLKALFYEEKLFEKRIGKLNNGYMHVVALHEQCTGKLLRACGGCLGADMR